MDRTLETAAADLSATPWRAFRHVTLPLLGPGILAGAMLAFVISLDDVVITEFVKSAGQDTLPTYMLGQLRRVITPEMVEKFARIHRIKDYVAQKQRELREHNQHNGIDDSVLVNGRRMTNIGTFRAYLLSYLRTLPKIRQDMTFLVRQLPPDERGLPIEIYVFSSDQVWVNYEDIQADIFDHIFAVLPEFGLRPFQKPAGAEIASAIERVRLAISPEK